MRVCARVTLYLWVRGSPDLPPFISVTSLSAGATPEADLRNAMRNAVGPRVVWMDDVGCGNWNCEEPTRVWLHAVAAGLVDEQSCRVEDESHGFCVGFVREQ